MYFIILALKGYSLITCKDNIVIGKNMKDDSYGIFYFSSTRPLGVIFDTCETLNEALFKWNIVLDGMR